MTRLTILTLLFLAGCGGGTHDPWGERPTEEERAAWGQICGPKYTRGDHDVAVFYETRSELDAKVSSRCLLDWDPKRNRLRQASVRVGFGLLQATDATPEQIAPYYALVADLLPPDEQRIAKEVALGLERTVLTKHFEIDGGRVPGSPWDWSLHVKLR